ncbi:MAG: Maf family protein [Thioalkalivibrionaceae bacterium]
MPVFQSAASSQQAPLKRTATLAPLRVASMSPRRHTMLADCGWALEIVAADVDESPLPGESPETLVERLARSKLAASMSQRPLHPDQWAVAADTVVALGDEVLGKPRDAADAREMLRRLSGCWHRVCSGVALVGPQESENDEPADDRSEPAQRTEPRSFVTCTRVQFRALSETEIAAYVATGEPLDKAGAYALQGCAARFVVRVEGSVTAVIGLPLAELDMAMNAAAARGVALPARVKMPLGGAQGSCFR